MLKSILLRKYAAGVQRKEVTVCTLEFSKMDFKEMGFELGCKD